MCGGLWDPCACQAEFADIGKRLVRQMSLCAVFIKKSIQTRVNTFITT